MGCISSKLMTRSGSYRRHKMKKGSGRMSKGAPALPEDLLIPRKGNNHFLALVCTATSMTDAFRSKSLRFELPVVSGSETEANEAILEADRVDDKDDRRIGEHEVYPDPPKRSRSWHSFPLETMPSSGDEENCDITIETWEANRKGARRTRSFHTVEEYDKLLERIRFASLSDKGYAAADPIEKETLTTPIGMNYRAELNVADSQETLRPLQGNESLAGESSTSDETVKESFPSESTPEYESKDQEEEPVLVETDILSESGIEDDDPQEIHLTAKGFKRKSIARKIETLSIPSTFELPVVASLREWLPTGQLFSPGIHPTPRFGSYVVPTDETMNVGDESIFNEELVTALEEQLQQLKAEEETILKQITAAWEDSASTEIKEEIAFY